MSNSEQIRRIQLRESIESQCKSSIEEKITRYLEIEHQGIIGGHYFSKASTECIYLYRDGYFIAAVMMSHAINEGIIKFITERNHIDKQKKNGNTKTIEELINEFKKRNIISDNCAEVSMKIWGSYRANIHHMNPLISKIDFERIALQNIKCLSIIEREIFDYDVNKGTIAPHQPKYWDVNEDGTVTVFLRLE